MWSTNMIFGSDGPFWTMVILSPSEFHRMEHIKSQYSRNSSITTSRCLASALFEILCRWREISEDLQGILQSDDLSFMDPDECVSLLYDDSTLSKSKFYFWAIECLTSFKSRITNNIGHFELYQDAHMTRILPFVQHETQLALKKLNPWWTKHLAEMVRIKDGFTESLSRLEKKRNGVRV